MRKTLYWSTCLALCLIAWAVLAQPAAGVLFFFEGSTAEAKLFGTRVELLPVLELIGADAAFSLSAGTYAVAYEGHFIQFAPNRSSLLVDGELRDSSEAPAPIPDGVAASLGYLERSLLGPLGFHLEAEAGGYRIMPGARYADPVRVRAIAADFATTTTLVLELARPCEAKVVRGEDDRLHVRFADASPELDSTIPLRSRRVRLVTTEAQEMTIVVPEGVGLLSSHNLDSPARVIIELGAVQPTPTPAPVRVMDNPGPPPIVIDPGHGGDDTGAVAASGLMEKELTLAIAQRLQRILRAQGYAVRLTRSGDELRALSDRTALANRLDAVCFVSLHANASTVASVRGAETYYMSLDSSSTDAAAAATADLENQASGSSRERNSLDLILWDLAQAEVLNESAHLALRIQQHLNHELELRDRGVKQAPFVVLTGATMPAALVEVGFLSNPGEAELLSSAGHQQKIAEAIARGILDFTGSR